MNETTNEGFIETQKNQRFFVPQNSERIFREIESQLLSVLFNYAIPFIDNKIKQPQIKPKQQANNLENIVNNAKPKIDFADIKELEKLLLQNLSRNVKVSKKASLDSKHVVYSINLRRQKSKNEKLSNYSISIKYEENESGEKLRVSVKKDGREVYSTEITENKEQKDKIAPYGVVIAYEDRYAEERLTITYKQQLKNYMKKHVEEKEDMTNRVPLKWLNILPETMMGGVLGFTYLGENFMGRRADLIGKTARMVDIHESIHTPDEYETRVLTSWIMDRVRGKYVK
ncbi:hypothetical protein HYX02_00175 [Candidatus Woesearchaeota archaeon]|nr:hypothetical protein [Candidatus Woesearchaeota archaeon]